MTAPVPIAFWWDTHAGASSEVLICLPCGVALAPTVPASDLIPVTDARTLRAALQLEPAERLTCERCEAQIITREQEPRS